MTGRGTRVLTGGLWANLLSVNEANGELLRSISGHPVLYCIYCGEDTSENGK